MTIPKLTAHNATTLLNELTRYCQQLNYLLEQDKEYVRNQQFDKLNQSNQDKIVSLSKMLEILKPYSHPSSNNKTLFDQISEIEKQDKKFAQYIEKHKNELKTSIKACNDNLAINQVVVSDNIANIKNLFDRLLQSNRLDATYENLGK